MKILVTGTEGQLARSLVERASGLPGIDLVAVGRPDLDLEKPGSAATVVGSVRPDIVVNAAAYTAVDQAEEEPARARAINAEGPEELARAAADVGAAIIQLSTNYVFDGLAARPYAEDAPTNPLGVYGATKLEGELRVAAANPRHLIVRTAGVYSATGRNFIKSIVTAARTQDRLRVVDDQTVNPTSADDLADGLLRIVERRTDSPALWGRIYHLAGGGSTSWCGMAQEIMDQCARLGAASATVEPISTAEWPTPAKRPLNGTLNCDGVTSDFGVTLPDWRTSLVHVVEQIVSSAG